MDRQIGPYEIESELGRGGMGVVYRAHDPRLGRDVAIKALPEELAQDAARLERFEREARTLAQLNHPNLAGIHGLEEHGGDRYLVLEFVEGETLAERLDRGALDPDEAVELAAQIASGIEAAHEAGVIHRDLKPANVMITPEGRAKVLDFGLARADDGASSTGSSEAATLTTPVKHSPTEPGVVLGTAAYMSPEQARGRRVDRRTDVWSFGVILYEMLCGASPFVGETAGDSIGAVLHKEIDLSRLPPQTPARVRRVLERCLQRDKSLRYRDIGDVRIELVSGAESEAAAVGGGSSSLAWIVAAAALVAAAACAGLLLTRAPARPASMELAIAPPDGAVWQVESNIGWAQVSPDGQRVVAYAAGPEGAGLIVRALDRRETRLLPDTQGAHYPFWSPDGRWLAFFQGGSLMKLEVAGGLPERVCAATNGRGGDWSEAGRIVFSPDGGGDVWVVSADGGEPERVTERAAEETAHYWPQWLPDGERFIYFIRSQDRQLQGVFLGSAAGGIDDARNRVVASTSSGLLAKGPDGRSLVLMWVQEGELLARDFDSGRGTLRGPTSRIATGVRVLDSQRPSAFSVSDDGTLVWAGTGYEDRRLQWFPRDGGPGVEIDGPSGAIFQQRMSPDGGTVAFVFVEDGQADIWLHDVAADRSRNLHNSSTYDENVAWKHDSSEVVYVVSSAVGDDMLMRMRVDGVGLPRPVFEPGVLNEAGLTKPMVQAWLPGDWLVVGPLGSETIAGLFAVRAGADGPEVRETLNVDDPYVIARVSPDGGAIAYTRSDGGSVEYFVASLVMADDGPALGVDRQSVPVENALHAAWSLDGTELFVSTSAGGLWSTPVERADGRVRLGRPSFVRSIPALTIRGEFCVHPDADRFLIAAVPNAEAQTFGVLTNWWTRLKD